MKTVAQKAPSRLRRHSSYERKKSLAGFLYVSPWLVGCIVFFIIPVIQSILYSFGKINLTDTGYSLSMVGLKNYMTIFLTDEQYIPKMLQALQEMLLNTPMIVMFSLFIAILLNQKFHGRTAVRAIFFLPVIIANGVIISIMNGDVFSDAVMSNASSSSLFETGGFMYSLLYETGISMTLINSVTAIVDSLFELIWKTGIQQLIFLAGLQTINASMYEVAKIEGATGWETFWKVTFPMISPMLLINIIYTLIDSFTDYSNVLMEYISQKMTNMQLEVGAAMVWVYFIIVIVVLSVIYFLVNKKVFYEV